MGRPREHDEQTAIALLEAAERTLAADGIDAVSVRGLAEQVGTTTRAVYSLFGSREGLLVALGTRAFEMLGGALQALPKTRDPAKDLIEAGISVFRRFATAHPVLFRLGFQRAHVTRELVSRFEVARAEAWDGLRARVKRLQRAGRLDGRTVDEAACHFHALCEGLADMELRCALRPGHEKRTWRDALTALVNGLAIPGHHRQRRSSKE